MRSYLLNRVSEKINILIQSPFHMVCLQIQSHSEVLGDWASAQEFGRTGWGTQFAHLLHPRGGCLGLTALQPEHISLFSRVAKLCL